VFIVGIMRRKDVQCGQIEVSLDLTACGKGTYHWTPSSKLVFGKYARLCKLL